MQNSKKRSVAIHRLVAKNFEISGAGSQVNHKDGKKENNSQINLEWCSARQNTNHAVKMGLNKISMQNNCRSKRVVQLTLNGDIVQEFLSINDAARKTGFSVGGICEAVNGRKEKFKNHIWKTL